MGLDFGSRFFWLHSVLSVTVVSFKIELLDSSVFLDVLIKGLFVTEIMTSVQEVACPISNI